jgi:hypothetical protein
MIPAGLSGLEMRVALGSQLKAKWSEHVRVFLSKQREGQFEARTQSGFVL